MKQYDKIWTNYEHIWKSVGTRQKKKHKFCHLLHEGSIFAHVFIKENILSEVHLLLLLILLLLLVLQLLNRELKTAVRTAKPSQPRAPELSGHSSTSTVSSRSARCQRECQNRCAIYTSRWYVRNYVRKVFQGGDHSKKVIWLPFFEDGIANAFHTCYLFTFVHKRKHVCFTIVSRA